MNAVDHASLRHIADDGTRWNVVLVMVGDKPPVIRISGPASPQPWMDYYASTVMERVLEGSGFRFGWGEVMFRFSPVAVAEIVREVIRRTPGAAGEYVVTWRPTDPNCPF